MQRLAIGGMAEVLLAVEHGAHELERLVVVKRMLPHLADDPGFREMFLQEARVVARLSHPNIVQIYELGDEGDDSFIAMEYVAGVTLRDLVRRATHDERPIPFDVAVSLITQASAGAHAAHELTSPDGKLLGLVHRDVSPHNLMVNRHGHVKLLDFGIAKATFAEGDSTRTGTIKGKLHYMSPEQVLQEPLDRRTDVFSLGIILWELFTGRRLFKHDTELATMHAIINGEMEDPRGFRPDLPEALATVTMRALANDRDDRIATADQLRLALDEAARACALRASPDAVAPFVEELMGNELRKADRGAQETLARAKELPLETEDRTTVDGPSDGPVRHQTGSASKNNSETLPRASSPKKRGAPKRSWALTLGLAVGAGGLLAGVVGSLAMLKHREPSVEGPVIRVGWAPTYDPKALIQDMEPLRLHLERATGRPIQFVVGQTYAETADGLVHGDVAFAVLPPTIFVRTERKEPKVRAIATKRVGGSSGSDGVLLASDGSGIGSLAELKGKTLCIPDENSTTGALLPKLALKKAGLDWGRDVTIVTSGNHLQVLRDILSHRCDAGGTYSTVFTSAVTQGVNVAGLRQLAITGRAPQDAMVLGPQVTKDDEALVTRALLAFDGTQGGQGAAPGNVERVTGFEVVKPFDYQALRELVAHEEEKQPGPPR